MNKRGSLAAALQSATCGGESIPANPPSTPMETVSRLTPSRMGKKTIAAHFDPAVSKQLKFLGLERDSSTQDLLREAINDLFTKYGKPSIALHVEAAGMRQTGPVLGERFGVIRGSRKRRPLTAGSLRRAHASVLRHWRTEPG